MYVGDTCCDRSICFLVFGFMAIHSNLAKLLNKTHENRWLAMTWIPLLIRPKWWHSRRVSRDCITSMEPMMQKN